jgi:hypothetical protein
MTMVPAMLLQDDLGGAGLTALFASLGAMMFIFLAIAVVFIIGMWKVFAKAGQPGWAAIVPIYNVYVLTQIVGRPAWWVVLMLVPFVSLVISIILAIDLAKSFGQGVGMGILVIFGIGYLILGFGSARYVGPAAAGATSPMPTY